MKRLNIIATALTINCPLPNTYAIPRRAHMRLAAVNSLMAGSIMFLFSPFTSGQTGVESRNLLPDATCGVAGEAEAAVHKAPFQIAVESASTSAVTSGEVEVIFLLTNIGNESLTIPTSAQSVAPNAATTTGSTTKCLMLVIGPVEAIAGEHASIHETLTGRHDIPGSLKILAPGESIQIQALFKFPPTFLTDERRQYLAAAKFWDAAAQTADGQHPHVAYGTGFSFAHPFTLGFPVPTAK